MSPNLSISPYDDLCVQQGLKILLSSDGYLLANNLNERAVTHKLAEHYQKLFYEWNVDCEYNRNLGRSKKVIIDPKKILQQMADTLEGNGYFKELFQKAEMPIKKEHMQDLEKQLRDPKRLEYLEDYYAVFRLTLLNKKTVKKIIYPDIIIHHRGTRDNHIVLEAKKSINKDSKAKAYDLVKLVTLVSSADFKYKCGYFINLPVGKDFRRLKQFSAPTWFTKNVYKISPEYKS